MVRVPGKDLLRPVELFEEHCADEEVRPGHRAQGQNRIGFVENDFAEPFGAANCKSDGGTAMIAPAGETVGKLAAGPGLAALVERDKHPAGRPHGEQQFGLARLQLGGRQFPLLFDFDDRRRRNQPPGIVGLQIVERTAAQTADREQMNADRAGPYCSATASLSGRSEPHIFSRV